MRKEIMFGDRRLRLERPVVMGILNVTPDSFYDGGRYLSETAIRRRVEGMVEAGAGIVDVGAYSTRPGAGVVGEEEELGRLSFAVELVRRCCPGVEVSIDTFRAGVAREVNRCLGPVMVNDISGGTLEGGMFEAVAEMGVPYVLMHIQGTPRDMQVCPRYGEVVGEVHGFLEERVERLRALGVRDVVVDPGFGFGKTLEHNYALMRHLEAFRDLDAPLLVGISRKSMIYKLLGTGPDGALNGTTVLNTVALLGGASILRVHDVREAVEAVRLVEALRG